MPARLDRNTLLVLRLLSWDIRAVRLDQLDRLLLVWGRFGSTASSLVRRLTRHGFLQTRTTALTFVDVDRPLHIWQPGDFTANVQVLAWRLEQRWRQACSRRVTFCWVTERGARLVGGVADFPGHASQVEHDLGTAAILTHLWETEPRVAARWLGEMVLRQTYADNRWLSQLPDGAIMDRDAPRELHEFGGQYSAQRISRFHEHCRRYRLPYRLW